MSDDILIKEYPWINLDFFQQIFDQKLFCNQSIRVCDFSIALALQPGENYGSQIVRAHVKYVHGDDVIITNAGSVSAHKSVSLIMKASLGSRVVRSCNVFEKEIFMFEEIIPKVENLLRNFGIVTKMAPACIQTSLDRSYLLLEDLNAIGLRNVKRTIGLDFDHLKIVLTKLSRWHAATAILIEESPELTRLYPKSHVNPSGSPKYRDLFENAVSSCAEVFRTVAGFENIAEKLFRLEEKVFERCCVACCRDDAQFNVLAHGDLWGNNIMFSYDEHNQPNDALLIDFQVGYWGSPVLDLTYLLFTSAHSDVKDLEWDQLIQYYYDELNTILLQLNYKSRIPSGDEFQMQVAERGVYSAVFSIFSVTMRLLEEVKDDNAVQQFFGRTEEDKEYRMGLMRRPKTRPLLESLLRYFDKKGFFD